MYSKRYTFYKYVDFFRPCGEIFHKVNVNILNTILKNLGRLLCFFFKVCGDLISLDQKVGSAGI